MSPPRLEIVVYMARGSDGRFFVRVDRPGADWVPFPMIEDALVDVSLELGERGILVQREPGETIGVVDETKRPKNETKGRRK